MTRSTPSSPLPIAVLISGGGRTLLNLMQRQAEGSLDINLRLVLSSRQSAAGLRFARQAEVPSQVVSRAKFPSDDAFSEAVFAPCRQAGVELVVMAGFLQLIPIPDDFQWRVMNIHPALIPAFSGKGYYGVRVHQAVLDYGVKVSGCTVHFVDNQYDHGPIILQRAVSVRDEDTVETLAARVFEQECGAYPEAIRLFAERRLEVEGRRVRVRE